jgi:hypothetical protein
MFRAGHAHAGVLLLMTLLYENYLERTPFSATMQVLWTVVVIIGVLLQSGGFFVHMAVGSDGKPSVGTRATMLGALVLTIGVAALVVGLIQA